MKIDNPIPSLPLLPSFSLRVESMGEKIGDYMPLKSHC